MIKSLKQNNSCLCSIHLANDTEAHRDEKEYKTKPCLGHKGGCPCSTILANSKKGSLKCGITRKAVLVNEK